MRKWSVYAVGQDGDWLEAIRQLDGDGIRVRGAIRGSDYVKRLGRIPRGERKALLLIIDAAGQRELIQTIQQLRRQGWRHVVVVATAPSPGQTHAVLHDAGASDIWRKSYTPAVIRRYFDECLV